MTYMTEPHWSLCFNGQYIMQHVSFGACKARYNILKEHYEYKGLSHMFTIFDERNNRVINIKKP